MKKRLGYLWGLLAGGAVLAAGLYYAHSAGGAAPARFATSDRAARLRPDYVGIVLPPNIAPLNFVVNEPGSRYHVRIHGKRGKSIDISSAAGKMVIPPRRWGNLLGANRGGSIQVDVYVESEPGRWTRFAPITNTVAPDPIDNYLVYRRIKPLYNTWRFTGVYQRDLRSDRESVVLSGDLFHKFPVGIRDRPSGCVNCHAFCNNRSDRMTLGIRDMTLGSSVLLVHDGQAQKVNTKFGYTAWHPSGRIVAYSVNKVRLFFHDAGAEARDVVDLDSAVVYYIVASNTIKANGKIADKNRLETYPTWSPDGRFLYFCRAPILWADRDRVPPEHYQEVRYDLVRIAYDVETDTWGELETVLSAERTQKSILLPRISPDGRFLVFAMCDYGCFPIYRSDSDLYIIDLDAARRSGRFDYRPLEINSNQAESWHCFSSNSRWVAFSSKRDGGLFARPYLAYIDRRGRGHKPFVLPQRDPTFYDSCLDTFSLPELVVEPVRPGPAALADAVRSAPGRSVEMPLTAASPKAPAPPRGQTWRYERE